VTNNLTSDVGTNYPLNLVADEADGSHRRHPVFDFQHPVCQRRLWSYHEMWSWRVTIMLHVTQQRDGLKRFPETLRIREKYVQYRNWSIYNKSNVLC